TALLAASFLAGFLLVAPAARAQAYPAKPVKVILPYTPGGGIFEALVRVYMRSAQAKNGQPYVIDYKPGAGGLVGAKAALAEARDGYTLYTASLSVTTWKIFDKSVTVDVRRDFTPVTAFYLTPWMIVTNGQVPARTLAEFIAYAKANPGKLNYGS